jgi:hypothetical protein
LSEPTTAYQSTPEPVSPGQFCRKCNYDLTGLGIGMPCPECGTAIGSTKRTVSVIRSDSIAYASMPYLRRTSAAALTLGFSGLGMLVFSLVNALFDPKYVAWTMFFACGAHTIGSAYVFMPRRNAEAPAGVEPFGARWSPLRIITIALQCVWIPAGIFIAAGYTFQIEVLEWIAIGCVVVGIYGIMPASWLLADHADWANDVSLALRLRAVAWMMGFSTIYFLIGFSLSALGNGIGLLMLSLGFFINLLFPIAMALYYISAMQYASNASWAVINAREEADRAGRMAERALKQEAEAIRRQPSFTTPPADAGHLADEVERKHREAQQDPDLQKARELIGRDHQRVIGRSKEEAYDLEEDADPNPDT